MRGPETPELQEEIEYFANSTGLPYEGIHALNWFAEIGSFMVPIVNFTGYADIVGEKWAKKLNISDIDLSKEDPVKVRESLSFLQKSMCAGIIAKAEDGQVYHARNFDNQVFLNPIQYLANFTRNGKTVFQAA